MCDFEVMPYCSIMTPLGDAREGEVKAHSSSPELPTNIEKLLRPYKLKFGYIRDENLEHIHLSTVNKLFMEFGCPV